MTGYTVVQQTSQGQQTTTVPAAANGTAKASFTLDDPQGVILIVTSTSASGWVSSNSIVYDYGTTPTVSSVQYPENASSGGAGVPGTFTVVSPVTGVASFTYSFDGDQTFTTVKAQNGDEAQISWTPPASGSYYLEVYGTAKDGTDLSVYDYFFNVS